MAATGLPMRALDYLKAVREEVRRVTWPTWDDLRRSTVVIIIVVIIIGIIIGIMDFLFAQLFVEFLPRLFG